MPFPPTIATAIAAIAAALAAAAPAQAPSTPAQTPCEALVEASGGSFSFPDAEPLEAPFTRDDGEPEAPRTHAEAFVESCEAELAGWQAGTVPEDRYWSAWDPAPEPWCSEFVGWNLLNAGLVPGETMPAQPDCADAYWLFYSDRPDLAEIHENDGSYAPRPGDIVLFDGFSHTEMVSEVDGDGSSWSGVSGGGSVSRVRRSLDDPECRWFVTLLI